jgi:type I restriction enzyme S subunit
MDILLSIKPGYVEKILSGEKKYEYRRSIWAKDSKDIDSVLIYATSPIGKVVASFKIGRIITGTPEELWEKTNDASGISKDDFFSYFGGVNGYAIEILAVEKCIPIGIDVFNLKAPPQSFCYVNLD